ncbi:GNAT family N-acetyltransferase [Kribbella albertanoniae]|uniref:GNAT family N-acetyltransferase n=1 Tax=Kribbella albertanoniae TaxID=1266829 RepID=A0A4R4P9Q1_9ACTN|nr:GNAT family N-acetyltransferase [Kribbella albertanoniae]TDC17730.1 GNAT family N-acetyltransferase [Kribbella albertanoniae]
MGSSEVVLRAATADDHDQLWGLFATAMMFDSTSSDLDREIFEPERALVATDGDLLVGTAKALTRDLSVPGAVVAAAHVTGVGVRATHRRQGILSRLMSRQLREAPEALAVLWASEAAIYGRFGYAPAARNVSYEINLHRVRPHLVPRGADRVEELTGEDTAAQLAPLLRALQSRRPGVSGRSDLLWHKRLQDKPEDRGGATPRQILVHRDAAGAVDGYALWRGKMNWAVEGPANEVVLEELVAIDPTAYHALWHYVLTLDLAGKVQYGHAAVDEPLQQLVSNPAALVRRLGESLWIRLTDVSRALAQRRYASAVDVVLEVSDDVIEHNNGRFHLIGDSKSTTCERTEAAPDLTLSVSELSGTYLGGRSLAEFAATGRVTEHTPGALITTATALTWPVAPTSIEVF